MIGWVYPKRHTRLRCLLKAQMLLGSGDEGEMQVSQSAIQQVSKEMELSQVMNRLRRSRRKCQKICEQGTDCQAWRELNRRVEIAMREVNREWKHL